MVSFRGGKPAERAFLPNPVHRIQQRSFSVYKDRTRAFRSIGGRVDVERLDG